MFLIVLQTARLGWREFPERIQTAKFPTAASSPDSGTQRFAAFDQRIFQIIPTPLESPMGPQKCGRHFGKPLAKVLKNVIDNTSGQTQSKKVQPKHVLYIYILCYIFRFVLLILKYNYIIYIYLNLFESIKSTVKRTNVICHVWN